MSHNASPIARAGLIASAALIALAACSPPAATPDAAATSDAMHMAETETAMDAMHMAETETAMEAAHMTETEAALEAMHMAETQTAMDTMHADETAMAPGTLTLELSGLEDLGAGWTYASWLIVAGQPLAAGAFTVDAQGQPSATQFMVPAGELAQATTIVVTIEPAPDADPGPSMLYLLAGEFDGDRAALSAEHTMGLEGGMTDTSSMATPAALPSIAQMGPMGTASR